MPTILLKHLYEKASILASIAAVNVQLSHPSYPYLQQHWQDKWLVAFDLCGVMALFFHSVASLVMAECALLSPVWSLGSILLLLMFRLWFCVDSLWALFELVHFFDGLSIHLYDGRSGLFYAVIMVRSCLSSWYAAKDHSSKHGGPILRKSWKGNIKKDGPLFFRVSTAVFPEISELTTPYFAL